MFNNQELTIDEIVEAYKNMTAEERAKIDQLASDLIIAVKAKGREMSQNMYDYNNFKGQFGPKQALETLAKTGVWLLYHQPIG